MSTQPDQGAFGEVESCILARLPDSHVAGLLDDLLGLVLARCGARKALLVTFDASLEAPRVARGCNDRDLGEIAGRVSTGVVFEALRAGRTLAIPSAIRDVRVRDHASVQEMRIENVVCVPLVAPGGAPQAALYVEGRRDRGRHGPDEIHLIEHAAAVIHALIERLPEGVADGAAGDPTRIMRERLKADAVVGRSPALAVALGKVCAASLNDFTVLLTGESGTGKTEFARVIHESSARARGPFVAVNCSAFTPTLVETELFGVLARVATGVAARPGRVELADGGTLFLDEVTDLPLDVQARLLTFLQSREYWPVGATQARASDVRVIAATNTDIPARVREKLFREDLFYRLNVLPIRVPPLRERREDIPLLADALLRRYRGEGELPSGFTTETIELLGRLDWPGNVRELATMVQRGVASAQLYQADAIEVEHLMEWAPPTTGASSAREDLDALLGLRWEEATAGFEAVLIERAVAAAGGNITRAAEKLGVSRSTLYERRQRSQMRRGA